MSTVDRSLIVPAGFAGEPTASVCGGSDLFTSERVPTTHCSPISTPRKTVQSDAIQQWSPIVTG